MARNEIQLITKDRAESSDDFRAQVRFRTITDKVTYALLHGHMSVFSPGLAAASRDKWRTMILAEVIEQSKVCMADPFFRLSLQQFAKDKISQEFEQEAKAILTSLGL